VHESPYNIVRFKNSQDDEYPVEQIHSQKMM